MPLLLFHEQKPAGTGFASNWPAVFELGYGDESKAKRSIGQAGGGVRSHSSKHLSKIAQNEVLDT